MTTVVVFPLAKKAVREGTAKPKEIDIRGSNPSKSGLL